MKLYTIILLNKMKLNEISNTCDTQCAVNYSQIFAPYLFLIEFKVIVLDCMKIMFCFYNFW